MEQAIDREARLAVASALGAGLVHELRNALAVAESSTFLAKRNLDDHDVARHHLDRVTAELKGAQSLVSRVLRYVRGEPLDLANVTVAPVVRDVLDGLRPPSHVSLTCKVEPEDLLVRAEPALFRSVIGNLLANALDALDPNAEGHIDVRVVCREGRVELEVDDNGSGLPECLEDPFLGLATSKPQGTGLGLVMVRAIAHAHGGSARAVRLERGTRVIVDFPGACI